MEKRTEIKKRSELESILYDLAESEEVLQDADKCNRMYRRLEALYLDGGEFRHYYHDIYMVIAFIKNNPEFGSADVLAQNIGSVWENYSCKDKKRDVTDKIQKLYDHINLEVARMAYADSGDEQLRKVEEIKKLHERIKRVTEDASNLEALSNKAEISATNAAKSAEETETKVSSLQKEYVAIMGIFAAIVMSFAGGMSFTINIINNLSQIETRELLWVTLVAGIVIVNLVFVLVYFINRIVNGKEKDKWWVIIIIDAAMAVALMTSMFYN